MRPKFVRSIYLATLASLAACAPKQQTGSNSATVSIILHKDHIAGAAMLARKAADAGLGLPANLCYAVHVTAPDIDSVSQSAFVCGPPDGFGIMSPLAYNVGDTAQLTVPVGFKRHFELIGFPSPAGTSNGQALCGNLTVSFRNASTPQGESLIFAVNGQTVTTDPVLFANGDSDVSPGANTVALQAIPSDSSQLVVSEGLSFGAAYYARDGVGVTAACEQRYSNPDHLFSPSGAAINQPVADSGGTVRTMRAITSNGNIALPAVNSLGGNAKLSTGLLKINSVDSN